LANQQISKEAKHILYHENTFRFFITHAPALVHGCCVRVRAYVPNLVREFPMLKLPVTGRIKRMELCISGNLEDRRINRDLRRWLTTVASKLTKAGTQLELLKVTLTNSKGDEYNYSRWRTMCQVADPERAIPIQKGQHVLEPLMKFRRAKNVVIEGEFSDSFPTMLTRVMETRDIPPPTAEYEDKIVWRRRYGQKIKSKFTLLGKNWFQPDYDWSAVQLAVAKGRE
jgi:hypothetical protein